MMLVVVAYDVNTENEAGRRRLRRVARVCEGRGQRVQKSVFECLVDAGQWVVLRRDLAKEIDDVVFKPDNKGYITDPIRRPAGFEIYRVEEHYAAGQASMDEVENEINAKLMEPRVGPKVREYLTQLRVNAFLQIKAGYTDSGAAPGKDTAWQDPAALRPETTTKENVAAHGHKKFLKIIPYGHKGDVKDTSPAAPPPVTPIPQTPAPVTPQ